MKPKAVIFYTYLPPWRIDVFNEMGKYYDLHIIFLDAEIENFKYDRDLLVSKLHVPHTFYNVGFKIGARPVRLGLLRLLKKHKPAVVFSHEYSPSSYFLSLFKRLKLFSYQLIITTSDNVQMAKSAGGVKALIRKKVLQHSTGLVVYSEEVKSWYASRFRHLNIGICPNIQNPKSLRLELPELKLKAQNLRAQYNIHHKKCLLYVGRLAQVKGLDVLLEAFAEANLQDTVLVLVGKGPKEQELMEQAKQLGIENKVHFAGFCAGGDLYSWYVLADLFVLPSRYEPFGAVVNEALIYGCPVLASRYIGALDFIDEGKNGEIFDPLNKPDFVETLSSGVRRYADFNPDKKNLMIREFDAYVLTFKTITE